MLRIRNDIEATSCIHTWCFSLGPLQIFPKFVNSTPPSCCHQSWVTSDHFSTSGLLAVVGKSCCRCNRVNLREVLYAVPVLLFSGYSKPSMLVPLPSYLEVILLSALPRRSVLAWLPLSSFPYTVWRVLL